MWHDISWGVRLFDLGLRVHNRFTLCGLSLFRARQIDFKVLETTPGYETKAKAFMGK